MHFKQDKEYRFPELLLYGFRTENAQTVVSAYIMQDENGWEAELLLPGAFFAELLRDRFPELAARCEGAAEVFFPDLTPDPPVWEAGDIAWSFVEAYTDEDEMFGDETIYVFRKAG